jgi:intraflagellar transport protein 81
MLKGEEFKKYVNELRAKSNVYKTKKLELSSISTELGILNRTIEILSAKEQNLSKLVQKFEKKMGIVGYNEAKETLEKVSERKEKVDDAKGKTLGEVSSIVSELVNTIEQKKAKLAPVIQELRQVRQENQELETKYLEKKRLYDITLSGLDGESLQLEQEVKGYQQEILNEQSRYSYLEQASNIIDAAQDRGILRNAQL